VDTLKETQTLLTTFKFDLLLAVERLADGGGYDLAEQTSQRSNSLLVGIELLDTYLRLPVVYHGKNVTGEPAINSEMVERELEEILAACDRAHARATIRDSSGTTARAISTRTGGVRRRNAGCLADASSPAACLPVPLLRTGRALLSAGPLPPLLAHPGSDSLEAVKKPSQEPGYK
jgi:hypothetical protein